MKLTTMVVMVAVGVNSWAGETGAAPAGGVTVCMNSARDRIAVHSARMLASKIFAGIGVGIEWRADDACLSLPGAIKVSLAYQTPAGDQPGALAYALPYEGTKIVVFYDRILRFTYPRTQQLLAWVLVHEISHVLQRVSRHSATGIMKARWNHEDYFDLARKGSLFTAEDVALIYMGLNARASRQAAQDRVLVAGR